jgi:uncharacterized DUF497 family protein
LTPSHTFVWLWCVQFTWDKAKEQANRRKHGVGFETVPQVFADPGRVLLADRKHSQTEGRFWCVGHDGYGILTVRFVLRAGVIRVMGAGYWRKGERIYEEKS